MWQTGILVLLPSCSTGVCLSSTLFGAYERSKTSMKVYALVVHCSIATIHHRSFLLFFAEKWNSYLCIGQFLAAGYLLHFLPYFLSDRHLFLHYYLPALLFKIMLIGAVVEHAQVYLHKRIMFALQGLLLSAVVYTFVQFLPLSYGTNDLSAADVVRLKWKKTWHLLIHKQ